MGRHDTFSRWRCKLPHLFSTIKTKWESLARCAYDKDPDTAAQTPSRSWIVIDPYTQFFSLVRVVIFLFPLIFVLFSIVCANVMLQEQSTTPLPFPYHLSLPSSSTILFFVMQRVVVLIN